MKDELKLKKWSLSKWKKELWKYFSLYVKIRDRYICFTCGKKVFGVDAQAGHFKPKAAFGVKLYFNEDNVKCQCSYCNLALQGNQYIFGKKLGTKKVKELEELEKDKTIYSARDYLNLIEEYKNKIKKLKEIKEDILF